MQDSRQQEEHVLSLGSRVNGIDLRNWCLALDIEDVIGYMQLPAEPGLGIEFDESRIEERRELEWDA